MENIFSCFLNDQAKQTDVQTYFCKPIYSENDLADRTAASAITYQKINALTQPATAITTATIKM